MTQINTLLELRAKIKEKKPDFIRQDYQRRKRLGRKLKWRKPKGIHSKIRHHFKGRRKMPSPGYKSPREVRYLHSSGLEIVNVSSVDDFKKIKKENQGIVISKSVGMKKRLEMLKTAKEQKISILNLNVDEQIKSIEGFINSKKKKHSKDIKKEPKEEKETKKPESEKIKDFLDTGNAKHFPVKEKLADKLLSDEQKKEFQKKEKDKVLTKKV